MTDFSTPQEPMLFGKWKFDELICSEISLVDYIKTGAGRYANSGGGIYVPHTAGRYQTKRFRKALCPIVERMVGHCYLGRTGRGYLHQGNV